MFFRVNPGMFFRVEAAPPGVFLANLVSPGAFFRMDPLRVLPSKSSTPWCVLLCRPFQSYIISCARARSPTPVGYAMNPRGARPQGGVITRVCGESEDFSDSG